MKVTKEDLKMLFIQIAREFGEPLTEEAAKEIGKDTFITLNHNQAYGGYRMERVNVGSRSHSIYCFGMLDVSERLSAKEMAIYMRGLLAANNMDKR